jgi:hypothetical protein
MNCDSCGTILCAKRALQEDVRGVAVAVFLNLSKDLSLADSGTTIRTIAIPISVGDATT